MIYLVCLDAPDPQRSGERVHAWLSERLPAVLHPLLQFWIIEGAIAAEQILTALTPLLAERDRLLVVKGATEAVWRGLPTEMARAVAERFPGSITERIPGKTEGIAE